MSDSPYPPELNSRDPIVRAKAVRDLAEQYDGEYICGQGQDFRDWLVERANLPMSGKTVDRYLRLLETPQAVQLAVSEGQLPMTLASHVALMPALAQQEVADRIDGGEQARAVVSDVIHRLAKSTLPPEGTPAAEYRRFLITADRTLRRVEGHEDEIVEQAMESEKAAKILEQTAVFADMMSRKEIETFEEQVRAIRARIFRNAN